MELVPLVMSCEQETDPKDEKVPDSKRFQRRKFGEVGARCQTEIAWPGSSVPKAPGSQPSDSPRLKGTTLYI